MWDTWRKWRYKRYEAKVATADDFAVFDKWASGPWTPDVVSKMPTEVLIKGPKFGGIDAETRRIIDLELSRRFESRQPFVGNVLAFAALILSAVALYRSW